MSETKKGFDLAAALAAVSKSDTGEKQIVYIDIDKIRPDPKNFYSVDVANVEELAGSIELVGLQQPILVRPEDGGYTVISGHRRMAALKLLIHEGKDQFAKVPCIVEQPDALPEMTELKLILANADTRRMTDSELSMQAERVERLLYELQEKGVEFPGRMRDHVAEAVKVSKTKLNTLKVIRTKLRTDLALRWEQGQISTDAAYNIARMPEVLQKMVSESSSKSSVNGYITSSVLANAEAYLHPTISRNGCPECTNGLRFAEHDIKVRNSWEMCDGMTCCMGCLKECSFRCPAAAEQKKKEKAEQRQRKKAEEEKIEADRRTRATRTRAVWSRIAPGAKARGLTVRDVLAKTSSGEPWKCSSIEGILADPEVKADFYLHGDLVDVVEDVAKVARMTGCSADYICGLTDDPAPAAVRPEPELGAGGWYPGSTKPPVKSMLAAVILPVSDDSSVRRALWKDGAWRFPASKLTFAVTPLWWIPLPQKKEASDG